MTLNENPSHPGEVLAELYLDPLGMSAITLARRLNVPRTRSSGWSRVRPR